MDTLARAARSALMRRIRGDRLLPETRLSAALRAMGLPHARNVRGLPGTPDIVFRRERVAVFVNG